MHIPLLSKKLGLDLNPKKTFMLGESRGGMMLFLALNRFPHIQNKIDKAVSLSGLLDMQEAYETRIKSTKAFDSTCKQDENEWISQRNPLNAVDCLSKDLPFLIIQGTNDPGVELCEGYSMVDKLKKNGNPVDYIEILNGGHCLKNAADIRAKIITDWLEK